MDDIPKRPLCLKNHAVGWYLQESHQNLSQGFSEVRHGFFIHSQGPPPGWGASAVGKMKFERLHVVFFSFSLDESTPEVSSVAQSESTF